MAETVGEDAWVAKIQEASRTSGGIEARVEVVELYKQAISEQPCSIRLWLGYCQWIWSLHTDSQDGGAGWDEDEKLLGQELFDKETALAVWAQGAEATKYRLNDSNELWDKWIDIELAELENSGSEEVVARVRTLFEERLQVPHSTWDDTFQRFSTFITKHDEANYEAIMVQANKTAKSAKDQYASREGYELGIQKAVQAKDEGAEWLAWKKYLDWEIFQQKRKGANFDLCVALHERALLRYGTVSAELWEDYADLVHQIAQSSPKDTLDESEEPEESRVLSTLKNATNHCPWSSQLWVRCLLTAESDGLGFPALEEIKEGAINAQRLDAKTGMELVYQVCSAWCGVLRRQSDSLKSLFGGEDLALKGTLSVVEDVEKMGERLYGKKKYLGDTNYRLEQALIQCLTERGSTEQARNQWKNLVASRGTSYEFWQRYYDWEMIVWASSSDAQSEAPSIATELLSQASLKKGLDWPDKITQMLVEHCEKYEDSTTIQNKVILARDIMKGVAKKREREAAQAAAAFESQQQAMAAEAVLPDASTPGTSKRKRDAVSEDADNVSKKLRSDEIAPAEAADSQSQAQNLKRDRENTTVIVTNLPAEAEKTKIRQFFKEYGHIINLTLRTDQDGLACTALIEFASTDEVKSALLRDGKPFGENEIHVAPATNLTLYVTNYPPTADDNYMHDLFKDCGEIFTIRWPSLKYNTHRRFCYISFRSAEAAASATKLDGKLLEGKYKLSAKYSDPAAKKSREGAMNEGREIHISNLDYNTTEDQVKDIFSKYGSVEGVRILRNFNGRSKGFGFVVFENKDDATKALALDKTKFQRNVLNVEISSSTNFKPTATATSLSKASSASPAPDRDGDVSMSPAINELTTNTHVLQGPTSAEIAGRTIALMNIPDTVNDARVRALAEKYGKVIKLVLRPDHQGAIIEYEDVGAAGRASLALEGHEINPGRRLRTGGVKDLFGEKEEIRTDKIQIGAGAKKPVSSLQSGVPIKRPAAPAKRGGLGTKRGLGFVGGGAVSSSSKPSVPMQGDGDKEKEKAPKKSNADFAAMFKKT